MREAVFLLILAGAAHAADVLTATLEPKEIRLGQDADLSVTFTARRADSVTLPEVDGLDIENTGQSSSVRFVNGLPSASTTVHVRVGARRAGAFTIPPIEASIGGRVLRSEPLELKVVPHAPRPSGTVASRGDPASPIEVKVSGAGAAPEEPAAPGLPAVPSAEAGAPSSPRAVGAGVRSLRPVWLSGWFHWGGLVLVAALAAAILLLRRLERGTRSVSLRALRRETDRAIAECDDFVFFAVCREAVQARLATRWGCAPGSITLAEMRERGVAHEIQSFFEVADAVAYSGRMVFESEMRRWQELVLAGIARMDKGQ